MNRSTSSSSTLPAFAWTLGLFAAAVLSACDKAPGPTQPTVAQSVPAAVAPAATTSASVPSAVRRAAGPAPVSLADRGPAANVYAAYDPPLAQPQPIAAPWAPPPMRAEYPPPPPSPDAFWTGGYWVWHEDWVWAPGRWLTPPRPHYHWVPPYYDHRQDRVVFVDGFWAPPGVAFVAPGAGMAIALAVVGALVVHGPPPEGPQGVFLPPPPGSRPGLLVPAPIGTSPYVMMRAPAIAAPGMQVRVVQNVRTVNNTRIDQHTTVVNNIQDIRNVTIEAPSTATVDHQQVKLMVPAHPHLPVSGVTQPSATEMVAGPVTSTPPASRELRSSARQDAPPPVTASYPRLPAREPSLPSVRQATLPPAPSQPHSVPVANQQKSQLRQPQPGPQANALAEPPDAHAATRPATHGNPDETNPFAQRREPEDPAQTKSQSAPHVSPSVAAPQSRPPKLAPSEHPPEHANAPSKSGAPRHTSEHKEREPR